MILAALPEAALVALIAGTLGALGTMYAARRSALTADKAVDVDADRVDVDHGAALLTGYDAFARNLTAELTATRARCDADIAAIRAEHARERERWAEDRADLETRIEELEAKVVALLSLRPPTTD